MNRHLTQLFKQFGHYSVLALLLCCFLFFGRQTEKFGDNVQVALPLAGLACAVAGGQGVQYFGRFVLLTTVAHGSKHALRNLPINMRPNGGNKGFPSGHMAAASFGATGLVQSCLRDNKLAQAGVIMSAGFVGGSRIEVGAHSVVQVVFGSFLGWLLQIASFQMFDRAFQRFWILCGSKLSTGAILGRRLTVFGYRRLRGMLGEIWMAKH